MKWGSLEPKAFTSQHFLHTSLNPQPKYYPHANHTNRLTRTPSVSFFSFASSLGLVSCNSVFPAAITKIWISVRLFRTSLRRKKPGPYDSPWGLHETLLRIIQASFRHGYFYKSPSTAWILAKASRALSSCFLWSCVSTRDRFLFLIAIPLKPFSKILTGAEQHLLPLLWARWRKMLPWRRLKIWSSPLKHTRPSWRRTNRIREVQAILSFISYRPWCSCVQLWMVSPLCQMIIYRLAS